LQKALLGAAFVKKYVELDNISLQKRV